MANEISLPGLLAELKTFRERSSSAIGNTYALIASRVLHRAEQLEDLNAERRFRRRPKVIDSTRK